MISAMDIDIIKMVIAIEIGLVITSVSVAKVVNKANIILSIL